MGNLGKRLIGIVVGVVLFIGIEEVRSRFRSPEASHQEKVTQEDADLYMQVLRATADRVKNPTSEDLRIIDDFSRIKNVGTATANDLTDAEKTTIWNTLEITRDLDKVVANDLHVDKERYENVKDKVELSLSLPQDEAGEVSPELTPAEKKALESKGEPIGSYAGEIKQLYATIYNNPLRKTVNERTRH
jgi:hypothetical protein